MVKRNKFLFFIGIFFLVFAMYGVSATLSSVNLTAPAVNSDISGNYTFNASITGTSASNVTFYWWNATNSSWRTLCYNDTGNGGPFTCSYSTLSLPDGTANVFNVTATNSTVTFSDNNTGITVDNTAPLITIASPSAGWNRQKITIYANATDATTNVTNSTMYFWFGNSTGNFSKTLFTSCGYVSSSIGFNCSQSFNTTSLADGNYTLWINSSDSLGNVKNQGLSLIGIDNTPPTASFSCSPTGDLYAGTVLSCGCTPSDSGSGVNSSLTSYTSSPSTNSLGTFSLTCSFGDNVGNLGTATTSYNVVYAPQGSGSSSPTNTNQQASNQNLFSEIKKGVPTVAAGFDSGVGIKQILLNVNQNTYNVGITVTSYKNKPSSVPVSVNSSDSGIKVFQYLHFSTINIESVLDNATIQIKVNKSWISSNNLNYSDVSLFHFDNSTNTWNDLNTVYSGENLTYYYYNATTPSFSYFAIASKRVPAQTQPSTVNQTSPGSTQKTSTSPHSLLWLWILLGVVGLATIGFVVWFFFMKSSKPKRRVSSKISENY